MLRMDEINKIKKEYNKAEKTINELSLEFNRSWNTVQTYVDMPLNEIKDRGKVRNKESKRFSKDLENRIKELLLSQIKRRVPKKQKYTSKVICRMMKEEGFYDGSASHLRRLIRSIKEELSLIKTTSYLPLEFELGKSLQIDHGECQLIINKERVKGYVFVGSVPGYCIRFCQCYPTKSQEAWGLFHEKIFSFFNGIFPRMVYDNDSVLVKKIIGTERKQTFFSLTLEEHYGFESHFCNVNAGNEKGSVENAVGYCRRNFLPDLPDFENWNNLNTYLLKSSTKDIDSKHHYRSKEPLSKYFFELRSKVCELRSAKIWVKESNVKINTWQFATDGKYNYSVPERYLGSNLRMLKSIDTVSFYHDHEFICSHDRLYGQYGDSIKFEHYLSQLEKKPSALKYFKGYGGLSKDLKILCNFLNKRLGERNGNKEFIQILKLSSKYSKHDFELAIGLALLYKAYNYDSILNLLEQSITPSQTIFPSDWFMKELPHLKDKVCDLQYCLKDYQPSFINEEVGHA